MIDDTLNCKDHTAMVKSKLLKKNFELFARDSCSVFIHISAFYCEMLTLG